MAGAVSEGTLKRLISEAAHQAVTLQAEHYAKRQKVNELMAMYDKAGGTEHTSSRDGFRDTVRAAYSSDLIFRGKPVVKCAITQSEFIVVSSFLMY